MTTSSIDIRTAVDADVPDLLALYRHLSTDDQSPDLETAKASLQAIADMPNCHVFTGWIEDLLVTSCTEFFLPNLSHFGLPYALIENVVTDSNFRNRGYGKAILRAASNYAFEKGCYKVMLMTGSQKPETLRFYETAGFEQTKTGFQIRNVPVRCE